MKRLQRLVFQGKTKDFWMETQQSIISFNISDWSGLVSRHDFIHFLSSILETKKKLTFGFKIGHMSRSLSHKCSNNPNSSIDSKIRTVFCFPTRYSFWNFSGITREILTSPMKSTKARFSLRWPAPNRTLAGVALPGGAVCTCGCQRLKRFRATFGETSQLESPKTVLALGMGFNGSACQFL